ncbi:MAG: DUF6089 family protein [Microscillaceae bacterium]|nr:DUF6089 family protein [Microscillaceae bacterium]
MKKLLLSVTVFLLCLGTSNLTAQNSRRESYWTIGLQANALNYFGDIAPLESVFSTDISFTRPNFGIEVTKKMSSRLYLRGSFGYGRLKGDDFESADLSPERIARYGRNLHFRNDIYELAFTALFELFPSRGRFYRRRYISPYIFAGVAGFYHNPKAKVPLDYTGADASPGEWVALRPLHTEGQGQTRQFGTDAGTPYNKPYSLIQPAIPAGLGVRWRLGDRLDMSFEIGFRFLFFDHLDDVGGLYPDIRDLESDLAKALYDRSAEPRAAVSGELRDLSAVIEVVGPETDLYGVLNQDAFENIPGFTRLVSYGLRGEKRGNTPKENDLYIVTGFHLNYILTTKRFPRYKRSF